MTERLRRSKSEREIVDFVRKEGLGFGVSVGHQWEYDWDISVIFAIFLFIYQYYGVLTPYIVFFFFLKKIPFGSGRMTLVLVGVMVPCGVGVCVPRVPNAIHKEKNNYIIFVIY